MADAPADTYVVDGYKITPEALRIFSSLLSPEASDILQRTQGVITILQSIPSNRDEGPLFRTYLLKCVLVLMYSLSEQVIGHEDLPTISGDLQQHVDDFNRSLDGIKMKLSKPQAIATSGRKRRKIKASFVVTSQASLLQGCEQDLQRAMAPYQIEINFPYAARLCTTLRAVQTFTLDPILETLPRAKYARFDCERPDRPASCLKGTRVGVIKDTVEWIISPGASAQRFFWLKGLAGTGKTTLAYSIANIAQRLGILGASFIFSRGTKAELRDPARVFPTIAYQLASFDPKFHELITAALKAEPQAPTALLEKQLDTLIIKPLSKLKRNDERVVVIVFDAFDECEAVGANAILQLLVTAIPSLPFSFKIFVTSRPEAHIRSVLIPADKTLRITALHEIKPSIVQRDILLYLRTEIRKLPKKKGLVLPADWVTEVEIELLSQAAGELFIYAKTLLRPLEEAFSLQRMLDILLRLATKRRSERERSRPFVYLDELYMEVLRIPITPANKVQALELLQVVLGTVVLLRDPLPVDALERLTGMSNGDALATLNCLHSVILPPAPPDHCPRTYHKSFPDFLQDPARCTDLDFFIDTQKHETRIAIRCLELLNVHLHEGMLGDLDPTLLNSQVQDLEQKVKDVIAAELKYACRHWAFHLAKACPENAEAKMGLEEFASKKMLGWMESLGWLGSTTGGTACLKEASSWAAKSRVSEEIIRLLDEGHRLLLAHGETIECSSQHVRHSVLPFAPLNGALATRYSSSTTTGVKLMQGFDSCSPGLHSHHPNPVTSLTLSPDGTRLVSGSWAVAPLLWNTTTGVCIAALTGHAGWVHTVTFSPDSTRLAWGSWDSTVWLWNATTGVAIARLAGLSDRVTSVTFSPDGTRLAAGSCDETMRLWDATTGVYIVSFTGHSSGVSSVVFSPDGRSLASGSYDTTVRLWDATTGMSTATLVGHSSMVNSVAFSPDGAYIQSQDILSQVIVWSVHICGRADNRVWYKSDDGSGHSMRTGGAFKYDAIPGSSRAPNQERLYWAPSHSPKCLLCVLTPGTDVKELESRRLVAGVEVVALGGGNGRVIIMHIQLPRAIDTQ